MLNNLINLLKSSFSELKKTKTIVTLGLLLAIALTLSTQSIKVGSYFVLSFTFICTSLAGFLFGPIPTALLGGLIDVVGHIMSPMGSYFFGYTFNAILSGFFYGLLLYKKQYQSDKLLIRVIISRLLVSIIVNLGFGTLWTSMFFGKSFWVLLPTRALKEVVVAPMQVFLVYTLIKVINKNYSVLNLD